MNDPRSSDRNPATDRPVGAPASGAPSALRPAPSVVDDWEGESESDWLGTKSEPSSRANPGSSNPIAPSTGAPNTGAPSDGQPPASRRNRGTDAPTKKRGRRERSHATVPADKREPAARETRRAAAAGSGTSAKRRGKRDYRPIRLFPRSVLGICLLLLAASVGAAISGTTLFMRYQYRKDLSDAKVAGLDKRIALGQEAIKAEGVNAQARIQAELDPLLKQAAIGDTLERVLRETQPSVWAIRTANLDGAPIIGSAFVVASDAEKSFLVTSLNVVRAATVKPGPEIVARKGNEELQATLWTWQDERDLALLIIKKGNLPRLAWAPATDVRVGTQVFAVSGLGSAGGAVTNGFVADISASGIQHSAPMGTAFQGGPILNERGRVVAIASRTYAPLGFASDGIWFAPVIGAACEKILRCPNGQVTGAGPQQ